MSEIIELPVYSDERGKLTVIERVLPFEIKRVYFIYNIKGTRGGHRHKRTKQALICINGICEVYIEKPDKRETVILDQPNKCLILNPEDWHTIDSKSEGTIVLVLASEFYDKDDYIIERYIHD